MRLPCTELPPSCPICGRSNFVIGQRRRKAWIVCQEVECKCGTVYRVYWPSDAAEQWRELGIKRSEAKRLVRKARAYMRQAGGRRR